MLPGLMLFAQLDANRRFLIAFEHTVAPTIITAMGVVLHMLFCSIFVEKMGI